LLAAAVQLQPMLATPRVLRESRRVFLPLSPSSRVARFRLLPGCKPGWIVMTSPPSRGRR
jgi:hypothetical protein